MRACCQPQVNPKQSKVSLTPYGWARPCRTLTNTNQHKVALTSKGLSTSGQPHANPKQQKVATTPKRWHHTADCIQAWNIRRQFKKLGNHISLKKPLSALKSCFITTQSCQWLWISEWCIQYLDFYLHPGLQMPELPYFPCWMLQFKNLHTFYSENGKVICIFPFIFCDEK